MGQLASVEMRADLYIIPLCKIHYVLIRNGNSISKSNICGKLHERRNCCLRKTYVMSSPCPRLHSFPHLCEPLAVFSLHHTLVSGVGLERERPGETRSHGSSIVMLQRQHPPTLAWRSAGCLFTVYTRCSGLMAANDSRLALNLLIKG